MGAPRDCIVGVHLYVRMSGGENCKSIQERNRITPLEKRGKDMNTNRKGRKKKVGKASKIQRVRIYKCIR